MVERIICVLIGYICGLLQTSYLYGKAKELISEIMEAEMPAQQTH